MSKTILQKIYEWFNTQKLKPIQIIFLTIGIVFYAFTYTKTFQAFPDWVKMVCFIAWGLVLLLTGVQMGNVKEIVSKVMKIFRDPTISIDEKYSLIISAFQDIAHLLGIIFTEYNKVQGTDPYSPLKADDTANYKEDKEE